MTPQIDNQKQKLLDQVIAVLKGSMSARQASLAAKYVKYYFRRVPMEDLALEAPATLATIVSNQLEFIRGRLPGQTLIRIFNPTIAKDGWESQHTIIEMVNEDMPFLVDTATLTLSEMKIGVHLIIHPVILVTRDKKGKLTAVYQKNSKKKKGQAESIMQFQVDRRTQPEELAEIQRRLTAALYDAHMAVADWRLIEKQARDEIGRAHV